MAPAISTDDMDVDASVAPVAVPVVAPEDPFAGNRLFARLPTELMVMIARPLTTPGLCAFRASCRAVEEALFPSFRYEFFRKKQFMIEDGSLKALVDISRHERLASALVHVIIGLDHVNYWHVPRPQDTLVRARRLVGAQFTILYGGRAIELLAEAFRNLKRYGNPKTVDLRDFASKTRWRDMPQRKAWRSYGTERLQQMITPTNPDAGAGFGRQMLTGIGLERLRARDPNRTNFESAVFVVVLRALAAAQVYPANLEVLMRNKRSGLHDAAFDMTEPEGEPGEATGSSGSIEQRPSVHAVVRNLEKLHVDVRLVPDAYEGHTNTFTKDDDAKDFFITPEVYILNLYLFIAAAKKVRWLRINFQRSNAALVEAFIRHFASPVADLPAILETLLPPPPPPDHLVSHTFPFLERLDLGQAEMYPDILFSAIQRIPTLQELYLYVITFRKSLLPYIQSPWSWFLWELSQSTIPEEDGGPVDGLHHLRTFSAINAGQVNHDDRFRSILFDGNEYTSYRGPRMTDYLQKVTSNVQVTPPDDEEGTDINVDSDEDGTMSDSADEASVHEGSE